jgi:hypothetical protein
VADEQEPHDQPYGGVDKAEARAIGAHADGPPSVVGASAAGPAVCHDVTDW